MVITRALPLVAALADRMAVMYGFDVSEVAPRDQLVGNSGHPYTRALLNSTPNLDAPLEEMRAIEGQSPAPINVPSGCSYAPRCPLATEECRDVDPDFYDTGAGHSTACHRWEEARESITLNFEAKDPTATGAGSEGDR